MKVIYTLNTSQVPENDADCPLHGLEHISADYESFVTMNKFGLMIRPRWDESHRVFSHCTSQNGNSRVKFCTLQQHEPNSALRVVLLHCKFPLRTFNICIKGVYVVNYRGSLSAFTLLVCSLFTPTFCMLKIDGFPKLTAILLDFDHAWRAGMSKGVLWFRVAICSAILYIFYAMLRTCMHSKQRDTVLLRFGTNYVGKQIEICRSCTAWPLNMLIVPCISRIT